MIQGYRVLVVESVPASMRNMQAAAATSRKVLAIRVILGWVTGKQRSEKKDRRMKRQELEGEKKVEKKDTRSEVGLERKPLQD